MAITTFFASRRLACVSMVRCVDPGFWRSVVAARTAAQWCTDERGVAVDEPHDIIARRECIWIGSLEGKTGQLNVPIRTLESQRVPPFAPPTLCHPLSFKNYVLPSELAKVIAHCQPGLSSSYDHRFNLFDVHVTIEVSTHGSHCIVASGFPVIVKGAACRGASRSIHHNRSVSLRVRLGKARGEHNESGVRQKAEVVGTLGHFRVGPIVLKKSVDMADQIFSASWKRFPN